MDSALAKTTDDMMAELETDPAFLPSEFWRDINHKNLTMLEAEGIENFKRTVSQNYYNWLITRIRDPQFRHVFLRWLRRPSMRPFRTKIEEDINLRIITGDDRIKLSNRDRFIYRLFVGMVWEVMLAEDTEKLHEKLAEPETGNPIHVWQDNKLITQDLANSIIECNTIAGLDTGSHPKIAEIGGGYGRLAYVYAQTQPGTYFIFDIPPALHVAQWYLTETLKDKKIFQFRQFENFENVRDEIESSDVVLLSANQITKFPPDYFDVMLSISTLPEMHLEQAHMYIDLFQKLSKKYIFLKQWKIWKNHLDGTDIRVNDYMMNDGWEITLDRTDPVNPRFFNRVWQKTDSA